MKTKLATIATLAVATSLLAAPLSSYADGWGDWHSHRQDMKNQWTGLAIGSAVVGILGFATHNDGVGVLGAAGAVYSGIRASQETSGCNPSGYYYGPIPPGQIYGLGHYGIRHTVRDYVLGNRLDPRYKGDGAWYR